MRVRLAVLGAVLCVGTWAMARSGSRSATPEPPAGRPTSAELTASRVLTAELLRGHIRFLSSDLLEGRGPGSNGDALAQLYVATQFEGLGLKPGAPDGTYLQPFELVGIQGHPDALTFTRGAKKLPLAFSSDCIAVAGRPEPETRIDPADVVFVGFGIVAPEYQWDDFKGADVRGKVLIVLNNDPEDDPALFEGKRRLWYGRWDYKYEQAAKVGAAAAIIVHTTPSAGYPWQVVQTSWSGEQFDLPESGPSLAMKAWATEDAIRRLMAFAGQDWDALHKKALTRDFHPVPLGVTLGAAFRSGVRHVKTANVVGRLEGSDPALHEEAVVYSAHFDHLGMRKAEKPGEDVIYNGAEDNASGVAQLLAVARAFRELPRPPLRSVLFVGLAAEEQGLLGSQFLVEHPPIPARQMALNINIDGANIFGRTHDVTVIGLGKTTLDPLLAELARKQGRLLQPDAFPDRGFFYRSDQFSFAKAGVPGLYFEGGTDVIGRPTGWGRQQREAWEARDYHQPSDELTDAWDFAGIVEDARLYFWLGAEVAQQRPLPAWKPGDEFEATRKRSLKALPR